MKKQSQKFLLATSLTIGLFLVITLLLPHFVSAQENLQLPDPLSQGVEKDGVQTYPAEGIIPLFSRLAALLYGFAFIAAFAFTVIGGYRIMTSAGNAENVESGKKMLVGVAFGTLVALGSYAILSGVINILSSGNSAGSGPAGFISSATLTDPLGLSRGTPWEFYGHRIAGFVVSTLGAVTLLVFIYAGFMWLTSGGNEERIASAKSTITYGILGLAIILTAYLGVNFFTTKLTEVLNGGGTSTTQQELLAIPEGQIVPCFVLPAGKKFGATCQKDLTVKACLDKKGQPEPKYKTCDDVGACIQKEPYKKYYNRIAKEICVRTLFNLVAKFDSNGNCPKNTANYPETGKIKSGCYAEVEFEAGMDWPADDNGKTVACFRKAKGSDNGAICKNESATDCRKPDDTWEAGQIEVNFDCSKVGACQQIVLGSSYRNRIPKEICSDSILGPTLFKKISDPLPEGGCPFFPSVPIINKATGKEECYTKVEFRGDQLHSGVGVDLPQTTDIGACLRQTLLSNGEGSGKYICENTTSTNCSKPSENNPAAVGKFYSYYVPQACESIGYCKQPNDSKGNKRACKIGVDKNYCTTTLFPSIGRPVPPWGCTTQTTAEIGGKCYIKIDATNFTPFSTLDDANSAGQVLCK